MTLGLTCASFGFRYEWEGKLEEGSELLLIMKTRSSAIERLQKKVLELHPYEVPEFIAAPVRSLVLNANTHEV